MFRKLMLIVTALLALLSLNTESASASKGCWCWLGFERGGKLHDFGEVDRFQDLESNKKAKCSKACADKCASAANNHEFLCSLIGDDFTYQGNIGCFSVVGAKDNPNNTWDYDAKTTDFAGCSKCCNCPRGWYDKNRKSCVIGADCKVPGMPNGDKGGGYFAWEGTLFKDIPGASCSVVVGGCPPEDTATWTPWLNRDNPLGTGDFETLRDFVQAGQACANPQQIECRLTNTKQLVQTGLVNGREKYQCDLAVGGVCDNRQQDPGVSCSDYEVRFLCP